MQTRAASATRCMGEKGPPPGSKVGAAASRARPTMNRKSAASIARRMPHLSPSPPRKNWDRVMPAVSTVSDGPAQLSSSRTMSVKYIIR